MTDATTDIDRADLSDATEPSDFETRLRDLMEHARERATQAQADLWESDAWPSSTVWRNLSRTAMLESGRFVGLNEALIALVEDPEEKFALEVDAMETAAGWVRRPTS